MKDKLYPGLIGRRKACNVASYRQDCYELAVAEKAEKIVEVGIYAGGLSKLLASVPTCQMLWVVDAWDEPFFIKKYGKPHMDQVAKEVVAWVDQQTNVELLQMHSIDAAKLFDDGELDFWQTDGDHSLEGITSDLDAWVPKVKVGGIICGDNYEIPAINHTVDTRFPDRKFGRHGKRFWYARKLA